MDKLIRQLFEDKDGKIVFAQFPNLPIITWAVLWVLSKLLNTTEWSRGIYHLSLAFLLTWAYLEVTEGVNLFRKLLGIGGVGLVVILYLSSS